jgi:hypothetical protein
MGLPPEPPPTAPRFRFRRPDGDGQPTRAQRAAYLLGPIGLTLLLYGLVWIFAAPATARELTVAATASLFALGTTVVLGPAALGDQISVLSTWDLALIVMYLTAASSFFFAYNLDLLHRVPLVGPPLRRARLNAVKALKERPWIRRWATLGVGIFVFLPLPGSGSLGGSIVGGLLGLRRFTCFVTVTAAGVLVCLLYAWFGASAAGWANRHDIPLPYRLGSLVVLGVLLFLLSRWLSRILRAPTPPPAPPPPPA